MLVVIVNIVVLLDDDVGLDIAPVVYRWFETAVS
jgi:hypothetical protein